jgi:leader peptidase (prepilin peptidase)/N-methyltransferase
LGWYDLIPILSFLFLKGRCRYCRQKISWQYPLVELATGITFLLILFFTLRTNNYNYTGVFFLVDTLFLFVSFSFLIIIFVYDFKHYLIPDKIVYPAIFISFLYQSFLVWNFGNWDLSKIWNLIFGILPAFFFLAIILLSREKWMGLGDFKLAILLGMVLGWPKILAALFLAFVFGAIIGIELIILGKKTLKSEVPFGPFLITGTFIALFWGEKLINWYLSFFSI